MGIGNGWVWGWEWEVEWEWENSNTNSLNFGMFIFRQASMNFGFMKIDSKLKNLIERLDEFSVLNE